MTRRPPQYATGAPALVPPFVARPTAAAPPAQSGSEAHVAVLPEEAPDAPLSGETQLAGGREPPDEGPFQPYGTEDTGPDVDEASAAQEPEAVDPFGATAAEAGEALLAEPPTAELATAMDADRHAAASETADERAPELGAPAFDAEVVNESFEYDDDTAEDEATAAAPAQEPEPEESVAAAEWEPETFDDVWDPTDQAEPTAAADDAAEWPEPEPAEPTEPARPAWGPEYVAEALAARPDYASEELRLVAERVAERLEDLAHDVRRRGLVALGAGAPEDEQLKLDELSKLIAAVVAGFYGREE